MNQREISDILEEPIDQELLREISSKLMFTKTYNLIKKHGKITKIRSPKEYPTNKEVIQIYSKAITGTKYELLGKGTMSIIQKYLTQKQLLEEND